MSKPELAERYLKRSLFLSDSLHLLEYKREFELIYSELDSSVGHYKGAFEHYKKYVDTRDNISNEENTKKQTRLEMQYDFDIKQAADSVKVAEGKKVAVAELKSEVNKRYSLYGGLFLVIVFAGFMFNRFRVTQKQKKIIESQKEIVEEQNSLVEEKNKDILDSIHYARRIQRALLPTEKYIHKNYSRLNKD